MEKTELVTIKKVSDNRWELTVDQDEATFVFKTYNLAAAEQRRLFGEKKEKSV